MRAPGCFALAVLAALLLATLPSPASATLAPEEILGTWSGYCAQTAYSNEAGDKAFCTPKGVTILVDYSTTFMMTNGNMTFTFAVNATNTTYKGVSYYAAEYESDPATVLKFTSFNKNAACLQASDGSGFIVKVEGNVMTQDGYDDLNNMPTGNCPAKFGEPNCKKGQRYRYKCVATKDA